jgi:hypothetical protein
MDLYVGHTTFDDIIYPTNACDHDCSQHQSSQAEEADGK